GVVDETARHGLVVAHEPGEDRQSGGVGGRPVHRTQRVGAEVEYGTGAGVPTRAAVQRVRVVQLVQLPRGGIDDEHVAVTGARRAALDRRAVGNRIGTGIALVGVVECKGTT